MGRLSRIVKAVKNYAEPVQVITQAADDVRSAASDIKSGAGVVTEAHQDAGDTLDNNLAGADILVDPEAYRDAWTTQLDDVVEAVIHYYSAPTAEKPLDELYFANVDFTAAHTGAKETDEQSEEWGIYVDEELNSVAAGAGSVFGGALGPIAGAIAGFAAGWGGGSQFAGDEISGNEALEAAAIGAAAGVTAGYASEYVSSGESIGVEGDIVAAEATEESVLVGEIGLESGDIAATESIWPTILSGAEKLGGAVISGGIELATSAASAAISATYAPEALAEKPLDQPGNGMIVSDTQAKNEPESNVPLIIGAIFGAVILGAFLISALKGKSDD